MSMLKIKFRTSLKMFTFGKLFFFEIRTIDEKQLVDMSAACC